VDDGELLRLWRGGDRAAGDALVRRHAEAVIRFFRTKLGDDVEDLIQRTFLDLLEAESAPNVRATLFTIANRRLLDHLRARYQRPVEALSRVSVADLGTSPSGVVARGEEEQLLLAALREIPVEYQIALELAYWEDLSGPEMATVLGIAEPTVRSRLTRARDALRAAVERLAQTPALGTSTLDLVNARLGR
jgi:RNA polymerase sigma factor (sigma-70 family)